MSILAVENLSHVYGAGLPGSKAAINNISFSLEKGEVLGIVGHTGSGKSTLVTHLNGLMKPTDGRILLDGTDIWENPKEIKKIRSRVGLVFQYPEYQLFEETVYKDISFGPTNAGIEAEELDSIVREAARLMHIPDDLLEKSPFDLSGGEKRRVAIAGVLAMRPEIVVFDEPTAGLDPIGRETVFSAIKDYKEKYGATVIIVSHSMEDIAAFTDKVLVLSGGKTVKFDTTRNVFSDYETLKSIGLGIPLISQVFTKLKELCPEFEAFPLTVGEAVSLLTEYARKGDANA